MSRIKEENEDFFQRRAQQSEPEEISQHSMLMEGVKNMRKMTLRFEPIRGTQLLKLKGRYHGMIYSSKNQPYSDLIAHIEKCGFEIIEEFFCEESDEHFTNISIIFKSK